MTSLSSSAITGRPSALWAGAFVAAETAPPLQERERVGLALRAARKAASISTQAGADAAGISVPTLGSIERGSHSLTSISVGNMSRLNKAFGLTWTEFISILLPVYESYIPYLKRQFENGNNKPADYDPQVPKMRSIRYGGIIGAGVNPLSYAAEASQYESIPDFPEVERYDNDDLLVLKVTGDSMVSEDVQETIWPGSTIILNTAIEPLPGDIVACWIENEGVGVLKVFAPIDGYLMLTSYNKRHLPIILSEENPGTIQGVYVGQMALGRRAHNRKPPLRSM